MAFQRFRPLTHLPQLPAFVTYRRLYQVDHCRAHLSDADSVSLPARFTSPDLDTFDLIALPHIDVATALQTRPVTVTHPIVSLYLCFVSPCRFACPLSGMPFLGSPCSNIYAHRDFRVCRKPCIPRLLQLSHCLEPEALVPWLGLTRATQHL